MSKQKVYFSSLLAIDFPNVYNQLNTILKEHNVQIGLLEKTKDIWCRDYMPVEAANGSYIQFQYQPDYLKGYKELLSDPSLVNAALGIEPHYSNIVLDGGNLVKHGSKAILTDKVFIENPTYDKDRLIEEIKSLLQLDELIVIPRQPYEMTGHADGMVRFIDESRVLINDFSKESKTFNTTLAKTLEKAGLKIEQLAYLDDFYTSERDWGAYINFLQTEDLIVVPTFGIIEDLFVLVTLEQIYPAYQVVNIHVPELIKEGGALNCISWTKV